jgi:hypothetical protein
MLLILFSSNIILFQAINKSISIKDFSEDLNSSGFWATLDLYDSGINNTRIQTNSIINVQGRLYNLFNGSGKVGYTVIIYVDGTPYSNFNDITDGSGSFNIAYTIDDSLDVFTSHTLEVIVQSPTPPGNVDYASYLNFDVNTTSYIELNDPTEAKMLGENLEFDGYLRYENGAGISFEPLNYYWYDGPTLVYSDIVYTNADGEINDIYIPDTAGDDLTLLFSYSNLPYVAYTENSMVNPKIFSNISCNWNLPSQIIENRNLRIRGQIVSLNNPTLPINNRNIRILYNSSVIANLATDSGGYFDYSYSLANGTGTFQLEIEMDGPLGVLSTSHSIMVESAPPTTPPQVPFMNFFTIFIPIIVGIIVGLALYGFYRYKKNEKESRVVHLPLENRILNLKILKDSGRLEESLSYLFNAIYMDLINAKYGRTRKNTETIRDFAIISVTQLNLTPTSIYPFIQKVEEIIYAKPFQINDKDFYNTIELFSPIYHELTGYNFVINF